MRQEVRSLLEIGRERLEKRMAECQAEADRIESGISPLARRVLENEFLRHQKATAKPFVDLRGKRYGRLIVVSLDQRHPTGGNRRYLCCCDCGKVKSVAASNLTTGATRSCGCLAIEVARKKLPKASAAWAAMSRGAKSRGAAA